MPSFKPGVASRSRLPPEGPPTADATGSHILFGQLGLRAGWGILLYLVFAVALGAGLFFALASGTGKLAQIQADMAEVRAASKQRQATGATPVAQSERLSSAAVSEVAQAGAVLLAGVGMSLLERRRFAVYGLPRRRIADLVPGALWGLAAMGTLVGVLRALHLLVFDRELLHGTAIATHGLAWLAVFLLVGLFEEYLFRGYIQFTQMRGFLGLAERFAPLRARSVAFWMSALLWSGIFLLSHLSNAGENPAGLASVFLAGVLFSYALWRTGSLWWGIGFHMAWDWSQSFLFGVPDSGILSQGRLFQTHATGSALLSGGVDGPEGSLLLIPVLLLMFAVLRLHRPAMQPSLEPEPSRQELLDGIA